eukprot:6956253-Pyramimonas_sp.AAC.1
MATAPKDICVGAFEDVGKGEDDIDDDGGHEGACICLISTPYDGGGDGDVVDGADADADTADDDDAVC